MKRILALAFSAIVSLGAMAQFESAPAFPGAEGHGRYVTGGRGGTVYHVTNLNDSGTGSLRDAISQGNRIIVFDVSGYIDLKSDLKISKSNITIAGQTAPGDGITVRYRTFYVGGNNIIVRFLRFRRSQVKDVNDGADAAWGRNQKNIILDHCSFSWSIDEIASFYDNANFTMQWCTMSEALANPGHSKGEHSYGGIWGGKNASFHHNFLSNMQNRVPRFCGARYNYTANKPAEYENCIQAERVDFRNCVMYNWGSGNGCYGGTGGGNINIVNNYYKAGTATSNKTRVTQISVATSSNASGSPFMGYACRYFIDGNYVTAASTPENYDWKGVTYDAGLSIINSDRYIPDATHKYGEDQEYVQDSKGVDCIRLRLDEPVAPGAITTQAATVAYEKVLDYAGASLHRDACDARYMEEARTGTTTYKGAVSKRSGIVDVINDPEAETQDETVPSYPALASVSRDAAFDTDQDGMPDAWETANGLDPNNAEDGNLYTIDAKGYYTNVEVYLNSLVEHIVVGGNADAIDSFEEYYPSCEKTGVTNIEAAAPVAFRYYDLSGKQIAEPAEGVSIRQQIFTDGSVLTDKVIRK